MRKSYTRLLVSLGLCLAVGCSQREPANVNVTVPVSSTLGASAGADSAEREREEEAEREVLAKLPDFAAIPLPKNKPAPESGILLSPRQAAEAALDAAEAEKLGVENKVLVETRQRELELLTQQVKNLEKDLAKARQKSFWDENKGIITGIAGALLGAGFSLGIFKAANHINDN